MIPKGSQRAGGQQLATHLSNEFDNYRVVVAQVRGAVAQDLHGAFAEWSATAQGTRCRKYLYSLSVNPDPEQGPLTREQYLDFIDRAEEKLAQQLCIRIRSEEATPDRLTAMRQLLQARPGDCAVTLHVVIPDESETVIAVSAVRGVRPDETLRRDLDALFGRVVSELAL